MGSIKRLIEKNMTGSSYVHSLMIGKNVIEDETNGFFLNVNDQITMACGLIKNDTNLANGYNAMGFSQGGQFLRAVAQRCPEPPMLNLISIGGQHQGVFGLPKCPMNITPKLCDEIRQLLNLGAYNSIVQDRLVQAEYWHDPLNEKEYRDVSVFLADINQEKTYNDAYRTNLLKLKNLVLVKFNQDSMVVPIDSEWFGFYDPGQEKTIYQMEQSVLYTNDTLGLQTLDKSGRVHKLAVDGDHLQFSDIWFINNIMPFLRGEK